MFRRKPATIIQHLFCADSSYFKRISMGQSQRLLQHPASDRHRLLAGQHAAAFWHGTSGLRMVPCPQTAHRRVISSPAGAVLSTNHGAICRSIVSSEMLSFCADVSAVPALQAGSVVQHFRSSFNVFPEIFREHIFHFERPAFPKRSHNSRKSFIILSFISIIFRFTQHSFFIQILFLLF